MPAAAGTMVDILGSNWAAWVDLFRNVALVLIAPTLFVGTLLVQRTKSTHQLIQRLTTPALLDTYERLRLYRMFRDGESGHDPYAPDVEGRHQHDRLFDISIVLNFYEGICTEVLQSNWTGGVWKNIVYENIASLIVGTRNILLVWYEEATSPNGEQPYPNIRRVAAESESRANRQKFPIVDRLPGPKNEQTRRS